MSGLLRNWGMPDEGDPVIRERLVRARGEVAGFISARPDFLHKLPGDETSAGGAWPSPRSWADLAVPALAHAPFTGDRELRQAVERDLVAGSVGEGVALEFLAWRDAQDLPDPAHLLEFPDDYWPTSDRADQVHATLASVAAVAINRDSPAAWASAWVVLGRAADAGHAEVAAVGARALIQARPHGADLPPQISRFSRCCGPPGLLGGGRLDDRINDRRPRPSLAICPGSGESRRSPFPGGIRVPVPGGRLFALSPVASLDLPYRTMAVDRRWRLYVDPGFLAAQPVEIIAATLVHEVMHCVFDHGGRGEVWR